MPGAALLQKQQLRAIPVQIQANAILNMSILELQQFVEAEAIENPALCVDESAKCPVCGFMAGKGPCPVCGASTTAPAEVPANHATERDALEAAFLAADDETYDPFRAVASTMDLKDHLRQQARMLLGGRQLRIGEYIIDCLDEDGYFREPLYDTAEEFAAAVPEVERVLALVQSFDPPGVGARDLRECLLIQLRMIASPEAPAAIAERMLTDHWDDFSRMKLKSLSTKMDIDQAQLREACEFIKESLNPRPASLYRPPFGALAPRETAAIVPDVVIHRQNNSLTAEVIDSHSRYLGIDETYERAYQALKSREGSLSEDDAKHIREYVERVKCILDAIALRKKTLARVALELAKCQKEFILHGPAHLKRLRQKDLAKTLEVHESTICRAVAGKYCKLPSGEVVSFEVFFDAALPIRNMISQLIARSSEPLSDSDIARHLAEQGVTIARRTVAKYREQLGLLPYHLRTA